MNSSIRCFGGLPQVDADPVSPLGSITSFE
jgi:hypothetical protein